jgi:NhaP-type Na+/H+ or K+/H+ antiporter
VHDCSPLFTVICGVVMSFVPHYDISFDGDWFLRILVPPIVFEAALSINKQSFNRHVWPIMIYAVVGTLLATGITAYILHKGTSMIAGIETIPYVESLTFGALISSIDPIAVLSVLNNIGMTDSDSIYVVIFGESLLNDGVALVLL